MNNPKLTSQIADAAPPSLTPFDASYPTHDFEFTYQDNCDTGTPNHPLNIDYFMPVNLQRLITARLSFKLRAYRTYSNFSVTGTNTESATHTHGNTTGESGHTHSHNHGGHTHTLGITVGAIGTGVFLNAGALTSTNAPPDATSNATTPTTDSTGSSGHIHTVSGTESATHTHTVTGSSFLGITEGAVATGLTVSFDGVDQTAALGGPFNSDMVEIDVTKFMSTKVDKLWHLITLQPSGLGRIQAILRLVYSSNPV